MSEVNANLTVNSLALLGFNTDEYLEVYPGLAKDIPPFTINAFERENDTALFCALHFLLCRLDYEHFDKSVCECWPYLSQVAQPHATHTHTHTHTHTQTHTHTHRLFSYLYRPLIPCLYLVYTHLFIPSTYP
jgi:hypothetical protein